MPTEETTPPTLDDLTAKVARLQHEIGAMRRVPATELGLGPHWTDESHRYSFGIRRPEPVPEDKWPWAAVFVVEWHGRRWEVGVWNVHQDVFPDAPRFDVEPDTAAEGFAMCEAYAAEHMGWRATPELRQEMNGALPCGATGADRG